MNDTKNSLASLAMDLYRVAIGIHRGSNRMAEVFFKEALARKSEINPGIFPPYIRNILETLDENKVVLNEEFAEDALMYSTLFQNYALKRM